MYALGVLMFAACGCGAAERRESTASSPDADSAVAQSTNSVAVTPIRITFGDNVVHAEVWDNPTGRSLVALLPLTVRFSDLNGVEKVGRLDDPLTMSGMPSGDDPQPNDLGWYAPSGDLVFYYGDVGYWDGIARVGRFTDDMAPIARLDGDFTAVVELDR